jgi:hypothetical protein
MLILFGFKVRPGAKYIPASSWFAMQEEDTDNDTTTGKKNNYLAPVHPTLSELPENVRDTGNVGFRWTVNGLFLPSIHVGLSSHETNLPVALHPPPTAFETIGRAI